MRESFYHASHRGIHLTGGPTLRARGCPRRMSLMGNLTSVYLRGVHLIDVHLLGACISQSMHLRGMYPRDVYLVHLYGRASHDGPSLAGLSRGHTSAPVPKPVSSTPIPKPVPSTSAPEPSILYPRPRASAPIFDRLLSKNV